MILENNKRKCFQNREKNTENYNPQSNNTIVKHGPVSCNLSITCFAIIDG